MFTSEDLKRSGMPESWACIDCGINTAPGLFNEEEMRQAFAVNRDGQGVKQNIDEFSEVYMVRPAIWEVAGMEPDGGCLCIGCLEKRLGRTLTPRDFPRHHPFNQIPVGTERLLVRRDGIAPK